MPYSRRQRSMTRWFQRRQLIESIMLRPFELENGPAEELEFIEIAERTMDGDLADPRVSERVKELAWAIATDLPVQLLNTRRHRSDAEKAARYYGYEITFNRRPDGYLEIASKTHIERYVAV